MTNEFVRVIYKIRRPLEPNSDSKVIITARKTIRDIFGDSIVPFDLDTYSWYTLENSGLRIRSPDEHDLNSIRIDINLREEKAQSPEELQALTVVLTPMQLAFKCLDELLKANSGRIVRCYISFELVQSNQ